MSVVLFSLSSRKNNDSIALSSLLRGCIIVFIILAYILCLLQYVFGFQFHADAWTYILIFAFSIFLYHFVGESKKQYENIMRLGIGFLVIISFLQYVLMLIVFPLGFVGVERRELYSVQEFNRAILIFGFLLFVFYTGIKSTTFFSSKRSPVTKGPFLSNLTKVKTTLYIIAYLSLIIKIYLAIKMGWVMGRNWESGWIERLLPTSLYSYMLALLLMWYGKNLPVKDRKIIGGYFFLLVIWGLSYGSRAGIYSVLKLFLITGIILHGKNLKIPKRLIKAMAVVGLPVGAIIWILASYIRGSGDWRMVFNFTDIIFALVAALMRLGVSTSNYIMAINDWGNYKNIASMFTISNIVKAGINGFVPGDIFNTPFTDTGNLWEFFMYNEPLGLRVMGEVWSGFGFYYVLYRYWVILVVFLWALVSTLIMRFLTVRKTLFSSLIAVSFFNIYIWDFFEKGRLDATITDTLLIGSYMLIFYIILVLIVGATAHKKAIGFSKGSRGIHCGY